MPWNCAAESDIFILDQFISSISWGKTNIITQYKAYATPRCSDHISPGSKRCELSIPIQPWWKQRFCITIALELIILMQQSDWPFSAFLSPPPACCWVLGAAAASSLPGHDSPSQNSNGLLHPPLAVGSLGHHAEMMTKVAPGPWMVAAATAVIPDSGRAAPTQQLLHRREQFPWISQQFPWISKALSLFSLEPQLFLFGCRKRESGIKKHFMETEFATDFLSVFTNVFG